MSARPRNEPQFFNIHELDWNSGLTLRMLGPAEHKLLSSDDASGALTLLVRIPPGWQAADGDGQATTEVFVLSGDLAVEGARLRSGGYAYVSSAAGSAALESETGAEAFLWWSPELIVPLCADLRVTSIWDEPWQDGVLAGLPHGRRFKPLRYADVTEGPIQGGASGFLRLNFWQAGYAAPNEHQHAVWEELIFLHGDWLTRERGLVAAGSYLGNPPEWWHGPLASRFGALALVHSDKPLDLTLREVEHGTEFTERYLRSASLLEQPTHTLGSALGPLMPSDGTVNGS